MINPYLPPEQPVPTINEMNYISFEYAGLLKRILAIIIDMFVIKLVTGIIGISFFFGSFSFMVTAFLYYFILESSTLQSTFGKKLLGLVVTNLQGQPLVWSQVLGRTASKILTVCSLGIGILMVFRLQKKQALHDLLSKTVVIQKPRNEALHKTYSEQV